MRIFRWNSLHNLFFPFLTASRLAVMCSLFLGLLWSAPAFAVHIQDHVAVQLKWRHQFQFAGYYAALEQGFYAREGLDVRLIEGGPEHPPMDELLAGHAQYAIADAGALLYRAEGKPVVVLASIFQHSPQIILTRGDRGIETPADLRGKRVMLQRGYLTVEVLSMLRHSGVDQFIRQASSYDIKDLIKGRTDAFPAYSTNEPFLMEQRKIPFKIFRPLDYGIDFYGDTLVTTKAELGNHPARAAAFRRATIRGWEYALQHTDEIVDLIQRKYNTQHKSRAHLMFEAQAISRLMPSDLIPVGFSNPKRWQHIADTFAAEGLIQPDFPLDGFLYKPWPDLIRVLLHNKTRLAVIGLLIGVLLLILYGVITRRHATVINVERLKLRSIVEAQPVPVIISRTSDGLILFYNKAATTVMGPLGADEGFLRTADFYFDPHDRDRVLEAVREQGVLHDFELKLKKVDGTPVWALLSLRPMVFEGEDALFSTFIDITGRRQTERNLRQSQKLEALGTLAGGIAHDFNNALAGLNVNHFIIAEEKSGLSADARHALNRNMKLIAYSKKMIRQMLMFASRDEAEKQPFSLSSTASEMLEIIRLSIPEHIDLHVDVPTGDMMIEGDITQVQQVMINLANNSKDALQSVEKPEINISTGVMLADEMLRSRHPEATGAYVFLRVQDNGHGIKDEDREHIFEPFFSTKAMHEGAGLGLASVYGIVKDHHGFIEIDSAPEKGTAITLYFPQYEGDITQIAYTESIKSLVQGRGETVLVADDDAELLSSAGIALERIGYKPLMASNGSQAWNMLQQHEEQISLVILDAIMPKMNGINVARKMRHVNMNVPTIFVTGYDFTHSLDDPSLPTNCLVLSKPYDVRRLSYEMRRLIDTDTLAAE